MVFCRAEGPKVMKMSEKGLTKAEGEYGQVFEVGENVRVRGVSWAGWAVVIVRFEGRWAHVDAKSPKLGRPYQGRVAIDNLRKLAE